MAASQLEEILSRLLVPDNEVIKQVGRPRRCFEEELPALRF